MSTKTLEEKIAELNGPPLEAKFSVTFRSKKKSTLFLDKFATVARNSGGYRDVIPPITTHPGKYEWKIDFQSIYQRGNGPSNISDFGHLVAIALHSSGVKLLEMTRPEVISGVNDDEVDDDPLS
jgi:hypothetical protein